MLKISTGDVSRAGPATFILPPQIQGSIAALTKSFRVQADIARLAGARLTGRSQADRDWSHVRLQMMFDEQVERLISRGYPEMLEISERAFRAQLSDLESHVLVATVDVERGHVPFVIVIQSDRAPSRLTLPLVTRQGKQAIEKLDPIAPDRFLPIESVSIPGGRSYLLMDMDRGQDTLNVTPNDALRTILDAGRSPLTIEEGIAVLTQYPDLLQKNQCFSLLGSRCGDLRVPAFWLSEGRPKLGWCWAGNPHTWLGSASCSRRVGTILNIR